MSDLLAIEAGLKNGEFSLEYLPIVELDSGEWVGAEALRRWHRPWDIAEPAEFVPLIEETPPIKRLIWESALLWMMSAPPLTPPCSPGARWR
jgi:EAL domain-containing protein (putative c-di-GMP-specific phosphodiesterase class I)